MNKAIKEPSEAVLDEVDIDEFDYVGLLYIADAETCIICGRFLGKVSHNDRNSRIEMFITHNRCQKIKETKLYEVMCAHI